MNKSAIFCNEKKYRYELTRCWDTNKLMVMFIGLNPSTADETMDDATIRRCIGFAKAWGYGGICMSNLFAYRATNPKVMKLSDNPIGELNDFWLQDTAKKCDKIIFCWGTHGTFKNRDKQVIEMFPKAYCIERTASGHPKHPLYLKANLMPMSFEKNVTLAKDCKCKKCEKQAVVFVGLNDPDGTQYPMCRKHADEWKLRLMIELSNTTYYKKEE